MGYVLVDEKDIIVDIFAHEKVWWNNSERNDLKYYDCCTVIEGERAEDYRIQKKYNHGGLNDTYYWCKWICWP